MRAYGIKDEEERRIFTTCYHEVGHALLLFWQGAREVNLSVIETDNTLGDTGYDDETALEFDGRGARILTCFAGDLAESFAWDDQNGLDTLARRLFFRIRELQKPGGTIHWGYDLDRAIELARRISPAKHAWRLFADMMTVWASDCYELLWRYEFELHKLADRVYRRPTGVLTSKEFREITKGWRKFRPPAGVWDDAADRIVQGFIFEDDLKAARLPKPKIEYD